MDGVLKEGFLFKEGGVVHNIRRRFCVLSTTQLQYFAGNSEKDRKKVLGTIDAKSFLAVSAIGVKKKQDFCFIISTSERQWVFWAESDAAVNEWIEACNKAKTLSLMTTEVALFLFFFFLFSSFF
jgi:hypothetical protein